MTGFARAALGHEGTREREMLQCQLEALWVDGGRQPFEASPEID